MSNRPQKDEGIPKHEAFIIIWKHEALVTLIPFNQVQLIRVDKELLYLHTSTSNGNWAFSNMVNSAEVMEQIGDYFSQFNYGAQAITEWIENNP